MDRSLVSRYFEQNSKAWIADSYEGDGYTFPTALARARKTISIISDKWPDRNAQVVDLGCGGGQLCFQLAEKGYVVTGVDASESMLCEALGAMAQLSEAVRSRLRFVRGSVLQNGFVNQAFDVVTALGVIGYLPDDGELFREAARLLRPDGMFIVSCRNRLLNMISISDYTLREIEQGAARDLVMEIRELLQPIPERDSMDFVTSLARISMSLSMEMRQGRKAAGSKPTFTTSIEARQHTPKELLATAKNYGFQSEGLYGVHPHLLMAGINRLLPPDVFNYLSSSLDAVEHLPVSLIWSSVFIGVFRKCA